MGGWVMQGLSGVSQTGVEWVMQKNNLKNDGPQNQGIDPTKFIFGRGTKSEF